MFKQIVNLFPYPVRIRLPRDDAAADSPALAVSVPSNNLIFQSVVLRIHSHSEDSDFLRDFRLVVFPTFVQFLVHAVPASTTAVWPEISRIVRLSGGVRKEILFCRVGEDNEYLSFKWFKP